MAVLAVAMHAEDLQREVAKFSFWGASIGMMADRWNIPRRANDCAVAIFCVETLTRFYLRFVSTHSP